MYDCGHVEPTQQSRLEGTEPRPLERAREASSRVIQEAVRLTDRSPRKVTELLVRLGLTGRGGAPYSEGTVRGWMDGSWPAPTWVTLALALHHGISVDEHLFGAGLRSEVASLREANAERDETLERMQRDIDGLRGLVTRHMSRDLAPGEDGGQARVPPGEATPGSD